MRTERHPRGMLPAEARRHCPNATSSLWRRSSRWERVPFDLAAARPPRSSSSTVPGGCVGRPSALLGLLFLLLKGLGRPDRRDEAVPRVQLEGEESCRAGVGGPPAASPFSSPSSPSASASPSLSSSSSSSGYTLGNTTMHWIFRALFISPPPPPPPAPASRGALTNANAAPRFRPSRASVDARASSHPSSSPSAPLSATSPAALAPAWRGTHAKRRGHAPPPPPPPMPPSPPTPPPSPPPPERNRGLGLLSSPNPPFFLMYHPFRGATQLKKKPMPSVADELAALRARGSVKAHATDLTEKTSTGRGAALSTPEAEEAAIKAKREKDKVGKVAAREILNKGSNSAAQASHERSAEFTAQRREELEKKAQASELLKRGGSAGGYSQQVGHAVSQTVKKREGMEKKNEAKQALAGGAAKGGSQSLEKTKAVPAAAKKMTELATEAEQPIEVASKKQPPMAEAKPAPVSSKLEPATTPMTTKAHEEKEEDDGDVPDLEEDDNDVVVAPSDSVQVTQQPSMVGNEEDSERQITNRNEKKARKTLARLGMRPVPGIARVTLKAGGGRGYFFLDKPDVFISPGGKSGATYVIFGEAKQGGGGSSQGGAQAAAAQAQAVAAAAAAADKMMPSVDEVVEEEDGEVPELEESGGDDNVAGEEGLEAKDIQLVMGQASCSRSKAVAALRANDGDLVNAIMSLTT
ncbi:hypothetical protein ACHAWF_008590 [Thalassiosira exigua]